MRTVVVGAGPVGLVCALVRAERGDDVTVVERDEPGGDRRSVFQYRHPHFFRPQVAEVLRSLAPQAFQAVVDAGAVLSTPPGAPPFVQGLAVRRNVLEPALRAVVDADERITKVHGEASEVLVQDGRVTGVVVGGATLPADLLLCATGRTSTLGDQWRPEGEGGPCGLSYVSRMYRFADGIDAFDNHFPMGAMGPGYQAIAFPQDDATLSALVIRSSGDKELAGLRDNAAFDRVASAIPVLAPWTDPARFVPITDVMMGGLLTNTYRGQVTADAPSGVVYVGDAVSTTNPSAGRGVTLGLQQAAALLGLLEEHDVDTARSLFADWCDAEIKPWYADHVQSDAWLALRWSGAELDFDQPLPPDLICDAAQQDPTMGEAVMGYQSMMAPPGIIRTVEEQARTVYKSGWLPPVQGPTRAELTALIAG